MYLPGGSWLPVGFILGNPPGALDKHGELPFD